MKRPRPLAWLEPGQPFPPVKQAWGADDPAPGLLAAGGALDKCVVRRGGEGNGTEGSRLG